MRILARTWLAGGLWARGQDTESLLSNKRGSQRYEADALLAAAINAPVAFLADYRVHLGSKRLIVAAACSLGRGS
jgi:hypothetical protein